MPLSDEELDRYAAWLMANAELNICNSDELIKHMEQETRLDEFLAQDSVPF